LFNIVEVVTKNIKSGGIYIMSDSSGNSISFKAETRQLLNILIHSLYTEREVFLRELISNASDALTRMSFEMLTNRNVVDPEAELAIWITADPQNRTITITDTGIGMSAGELGENLGTIAHSGARAFLDAAQKGNGGTHLSDMIGQFGVGFYSAFMVAESITVTSRSFRTDEPASVWRSMGEDTYTIEPGEKETRGTQVLIQLKEDAAEYAREARLQEIIKKHSDFIPYPIYLGENKEQANQQTAIWRKSVREVKPEEYQEFYRQFTLDFDPAVTYAHMNIDAPVQMYALLFVPASSERSMLSLRRQDGLKLYARKILIQEYSHDLLPDYLRYVQGVVDSEDIPLNVSRESVQSNRIMAQLKKLITSKVIDTLKTLAKDKPEDFSTFWKEFGRSIKEGVATDADNLDALTPLLHFPSLKNPQKLVSLDEYILHLNDGQKKIYYLIGEDERSLQNSPHLEAFRKLDYDVLLMADPIDAFVLLKLTKYKDFDLANASSETVSLPEDPEKPANPVSPAEEETATHLVALFKSILTDRVTDVRATQRLVESPARLVDPEGTLNPEMQRVYRLINREFKMPAKVLEINPSHPLLVRLAALAQDSEVAALVAEQIFENAMLVEGLHPHPASMVNRIQQLMERVLGTE
jgi:molecular chaperone HtpG